MTGLEQTATAIAEVWTVLADMPEALPGDLYLPETHWIAYQAFVAAGA